MTAWHDDESRFRGAAPMSAEAGDHRATVSSANRYRVIVVMEVRLLREALVAALSRHGSLDVVGVAGVEAAPAALLHLHPDVVIVSSVAAGALGVLRRLREMETKAKVVVFALAEEADLLAWAAAGASGYVDSGGSVDDLAAAICAVAQGEITCPTRLAALMLGRIGAMASRQVADRLVPDALTRREREVLDLLSEGLCNKEIARQLGLGHATVKNHVHHILTKLHARRRGELAARIRRDGIRVDGFHSRFP